MRVKFKHDITIPQCGKHPDLLVAAKGTTGKLIECPGKHWPAHVRLDNGNVIGCNFDEYEISEGHPDCPLCKGIGFVGSDGQACTCIRMGAASTNSLPDGSSLPKQ